MEATNMDTANNPQERFQNDKRICITQLNHYTGINTMREYKP